MSSSFRRNPEGKNQYAPVPKASDPVLREALEGFHRRHITNNDLISDLLQSEHGIEMKPRTVKKRRKELGFLGSRDMKHQVSPTEAEQLVINAVNKDRANKLGVRTITHDIAASSGVHLPRDFVSNIMHLHFPDGFLLRDPTLKTIKQVQKAPLGIHGRWSADGHDKLYRIGFPIWAVVDDATGKWLGAWVVPSNHNANIVAYLFLCLVEKYGGMPLQFTADCGSDLEMTMVFGFANALRDIFNPEYDNSVLPAHTYIGSIHNISIEHSYLRLHLQFGDTAIMTFQEGHVDNGGPYQPNNPVHYELCQWLWPKLLQEKLDTFMYKRNSFKPRKVKGKSGPNGISPDVAFSLPHLWSGKNLLLPVDIAVIQEIKLAMSGNSLLDFVTPEYSSRMQTIYDSLGMQRLTFQNVWEVFRSLLSRLE